MNKYNGKKILIKILPHYKILIIKIQMTIRNLNKL